MDGSAGATELTTRHDTGEETEVIEALVGTGLAAAAGLNAYIPLLLLGLLARFTDIVALPSAWAWLENEWVLGVVGILLVLEFIADKVPAVDSVNDFVQTAVRPASGGIVFGSGTAASTPAVPDPSTLFTSDAWVPVVIGIAIALAVHLAKAALRVVATAALAGFASPVLSVGEDIASIGLALSAILLPVLVVIVLVALVIGGVRLVRWSRRRSRERPRVV